MAGHMDGVRALTEELTIQRILLESIQGENFVGLDDERREIQDEIDRLTRLLLAATQKKQAADGERQPAIDRRISTPSSSPVSTSAVQAITSVPSNSILSNPNGSSRRTGSPIVIDLTGSDDEDTPDEHRSTVPVQGSPRVNEGAGIRRDPGPPPPQPPSLPVRRVPPLIQAGVVPLPPLPTQTNSPGTRPGPSSSHAGQRSASDPRPHSGSRNNTFDPLRDAPPNPRALPPGSPSRTPLPSNAVASPSSQGSNGVLPPHSDPNRGPLHQLASIGNQAGVATSLPSLADIIDRTNRYDYANGLDENGQELPPWKMRVAMENSYTEAKPSNDEIAKIVDHLDGEIDVSEFMIPGQSMTPPGLKKKLYAHQDIAVGWMISKEAGPHKGGLLADDMGLGKTMSTISLMLHRPPGRCRYKTTLIVCPVALTHQWEEEIVNNTEVTHRPSVCIYHGRRSNTEDLLKYDVVITTYGTLAQEYRRLETYVKQNAAASRALNWNDADLCLKIPLIHPEKAKFFRVVLDEAQCIKNKDTQTAKSCFQLKSTYRWCLTGTPMMNGVLELYSLVQFLQIKPYCDWDAFRKTFGTLIGRTGEMTQSIAMIQFRDFVKTIMLRRMKDSMLNGKPILDLPTKTEHIVHAVMSPEQKEYYDQLEKNSATKFTLYLENRTIGKNYSNILVLLLRMRQACCHPNLNLDVDDGMPSLSPDEKIAAAKELDEATVQRIKSRESFECPICYDAVPCPSFLVPCGHDACNECLSQVLDTGAETNIRAGRDSSSVRCPVCRGPFQPTKTFTFDIFRQVYMRETLEPWERIPIGSDASDVESDVEDDDEGSLRDFIVPDNDSEGQGSSSDASRARKRRRREKSKAQAVNPSILKALRKESHRNRDSWTKYMDYLRKTWISAAKVDECLKLLKEFVRSREKTIIFSQWTLMLDLLDVAMYHGDMPDPVRYDGSMTAAQRNRAATQFRDDPNCNVMLISLRAGNAGLNLTAASRVIIMDPFWNPYIEYQAVDRAYRIGQTKPVHVYRILVQGSVEDRIVDLQERKKQLVAAALSETGGMRVARLGQKELGFLFGQGPIPGLNED